jgi:nitrate reductase assembly molybdenum cofactor insertion protein NarJ
VEKFKQYNLLAELFKYPSDTFVGKVAECQAMLNKNYPEAAAQLQVFSDYVNQVDDDLREELYTKTFDVQPICYLDLGYVIFGEDYKRGAFLLHMQNEQKKIGNDCGTDLSDNICNVFTLVSKHNDEHFVDELATQIIIPGIKKMIAEFESARVALKMKILKKLHRAVIQEDLNQGNVYRNCFEAVLIVLNSDFEHVRFEAVEKTDADLAHHKAFFSKDSVNVLVNNFKTT